MSETEHTMCRVDALRGIAAVAVAFYHVRVDLWVGWGAIQANPHTFSILDGTLSWLGVPMRFMGAGVLLFFVISGFCIHSPQARKETRDKARRKGQDGNAKGLMSDTPQWGRFYVRRGLRIYPPYLVTLFLSGVALAFTSDLTVAAWSRFLTSLPMLQNYWHPGGQIQTNPSLWSLPVEMELYLVYPLAWWLGRQVGWAWVLVLAIFVSLAGQWASLNGVRWLDASFPRFWALWCAGAWVADRRFRGGLPIWDWRWSLGFAGLLMAAVISEYRTNLQGFSIWLWGLVGVLAIVWAAGPVPHKSESFFTRLISLAAWIGTFSYSLYLIHYPLFHLAGHVWQGHFGSKPASILVSLAAVLLAIPVAWVFHRWIEAPSHRLARRLGRAKTHGAVVTQ
jgi:peptidoglycan/LPS O-acetylase OafA/YrhL